MIYCEWDGTKGVNCQSDDKGYVRRFDGLPVGGGVENYNDNGFYELTDTQPTIGADQVKDEVQWSFANDQISRTWTVRDLTAQEIQDRDDFIAAREGRISREMYYVLKWLIAEGVISSTNINNAPNALKNAYQARGRLEAE